MNRLITMCLVCICLSSFCNTAAFGSKFDKCRGNEHDKKETEQARRTHLQEEEE